MRRVTGSHISLFSGVGMTDIAAEAAGFKTVATAEVDPFCRKVLERRFPDALHFQDVKDVSRAATSLREPQRPLLISGGFPCQDVSSAGTGQGLNGERSGLWSEFARVIGEFHPDYVLIENSAQLRTRGLDRVLCDLADLGYSARWDCIPAGAVGAPHLRDRIYILATIKPMAPFAGDPLLGLACSRGIVHDAPGPNEYLTKLSRAGVLCEDSGGVYASNPRFPRGPAMKGTSWPTPTRADGSGGPGVTPKREGGKNLRTAVADVEGNGRLNPTWVEWLMGLPLGWTDPEVDNADLVDHPGWEYEPKNVTRTVEHRWPERSKRIRALGNGLVPQAAAQALAWIPNNETEIKQ